MDCELTTDKELLKKQLRLTTHTYNKISDKLEVLNEEAFAYEQEIEDIKARLKEVIK